MNQEQFYVTANRNFTIGNREILEGDSLLVDPNKSPIESSLVLVGNQVEKWAGQAQVLGVVVKLSRNCSLI